MTPDKHLLYFVEEHIATIQINREQQGNTITGEAILLFLDYLNVAENDTDVRAVLVTGAGDKSFCTGAHLGNGMSASGKKEFHDYAQLLKRLSLFPKPTVARINGYCLAGGIGFMLACDIVIAADRSQFGTPEVNVGLWPMMIGALIFRNVPYKRAMAMILLGERLNALEALAMGLVTKVVSAEELDGTVRGIMKKLVAKSPLGITIGKNAFHKASDMPLADALDFLSLKLLEIVSTEDAKEGIAAFLEKRQPVFQGK